MAAIFPILDMYSCVATKWSRHLGFCITYTALLMKTWRRVVVLSFLFLLFLDTSKTFIFFQGFSHLPSEIGTQGKADGQTVAPVDVPDSSRNAHLLGDLDSF